MRKQITLLLLASLLASCGNKATNASSANGSIPWGKQDVAAVAFVGYFTYGSDFLASSAYKRYVEQYGLEDVELVEHEGDEVYLVIPRDPKASVTVNTYPKEKLIDPDANVEIRTLYKSETGKPFFIKCSSDGGMVNAELLLKDSEGKGLTYHPQISMTDGSLGYPAVMPEGEGTIVDITPPMPTSTLPQEVNRPEENISAAIRNGRVIISVKEAVGALDDESFAVEGINGKCIGLFTGDIGQDINPFLCMLMDDGGVELLNYNSIAGMSDIDPGHLLSSGRLPGMTDIVSFEADGGGEYVADGDTLYSYVTIYAIDKAGKRHEIEPCLRPSSMLYHFIPDNRSIQEHKLIIFPDWKIEYRNGWRLSERNEDFLGRIRPLKMDYENETYEFQYEMLIHTQYSIGDEPVTKVSPGITGSFRLKLRPDESGYDLTVLSGPITFAANAPKGSVFYGTEWEAPDDWGTSNTTDEL